MNHRYLAFILALALASCKNGKSPNRFKYTIAKDSNLYIQIYRTGLFETSTTAYLTDSANFSLKLGTYDDQTGYIDCKVKGDTVLSEEKQYIFDNNVIQADTMKVTYTTAYSLIALKKLHNFE
ncbi:hypothetical protein [Mucilaginibacter sp. OK283]|jgi:hypothetical protein|uniref:hypothetical protein n=1 Tax=Mucilaginibacter sp. OK283 TaxID=1881049 RepID=UPI0008BB51C1|nr:hypothetical protein [Mucilaginibacter sp. OK283]SEO70057.1 hypothetical protein SAMN05428947_103462 [Mucilaginibacter sp. OK283]